MLRVIHRSSKWLETTKTWLYHQVKYLPATVESHILCESCRNLDCFILPHIHSLRADVSTAWYYGELAARSVLGWEPQCYYIRKGRELNARILHSHFGNRGWQDLTLARQLGLKHVVTFYGYDMSLLPRRNPRWLRRYARLFRQADLFLCEGRHMASCLEQLGCPRSKVRVHHLGIGVERIDFQPRRYDRSKPLKVLIVGSFTEKKGITYGIEALGRLRRTAPIQLTIIGDARKPHVVKRMLSPLFGGKKDLEEKAAIDAALKRCGLRAQARMLGYQPHTRVLEEAYRHDMCLAPSVTAASGDTEGGAPVTIIEMAATGIPVISTQHCDIPDVLHYGDNSLLANERDVDGLVHVIRRWLQSPDTWADRLSCARRHIEREYNAAVQGNALADVYQSVLAGSVA